MRVRRLSGTVGSMSRTRKSPEDLSFPAEVVRQFGPFARETGMTGPAGDDAVLPTAAWTAGPLTYAWSQDPSDGSVSVTVTLAVPGGVRWGALADLVVTHRLGVPQDVRRSGLLTRQVASHTAWVRRLHATLAGPEAEAFLVTGGARFSEDARLSEDG